MCKLDDPACQHAAAQPVRGSRRRRLWELDPKSHCPVVGVCLSLEALRKLVGRLFRERDSDDYGVHVVAVAQCASRSALAELLQTALDRRHALAVQRLRRVHSADELYAQWRAAVREGGVAGVLWAALTHPACDTDLEDRLCREIHMLQHQAGAQERCDRGASAQLQAEHALLVRELGRTQERVTQLMADKAREIQELEARLMRARADLVARDSVIGFLRADVEQLRTEMPELDARERLQARNAEMARLLCLRDGRIAELQRQLREAGRKPDAAPEAPAAPPPAEEAEPPRLDNKTILCVGGRHGILARYRDIVEEGGGRFAHHDGGADQRADGLDADLAAADLVICQAGCISHNAYWRVKDYCKRTGKLCVFLDNPSATSFSRGLRQIMLRQVPATEAQLDAAT